MSTGDGGDEPPTRSKRARTDPPPPPAGPPQFMRPDGALPPSVDEPTEAAVEATAVPPPTAATSPVPVPAPVVPEPPLVPPTISPDAELRAAIGLPAPSRPAHLAVDDDRDDDGADDGDEPKSRRMLVVAATSVVVGLAVAATIFIGRNNASRLVLTCEAKYVVAEQGRAFPPWGERRLHGDEWRPIEIPPDFICMDAELSSPRELGDLFRQKLVDRADALLVAGVEIDKAAAMLEQALLHARADDPLHTEARKDIKQRLGDVRYWRASAKLQEAAAALEIAAKEFETAVLEQPRYAKDASTWATLIRRVTKELQRGPADARSVADGTASDAPPVASPPDRAPAPPGVALPVEPEGSAAGSGSASVEEPAAPPDAGVPTGGVLL